MIILHLKTFFFRFCVVLFPLRHFRFPGLTKPRTSAMNARRNNEQGYYAQSNAESSFHDEGMSTASWPVANDWLIRETELNFGSCHGLDQLGHSLVGVGLFFIPNPEENNAFYVSSIVPGSSAFRSGSVELFDKLLTVDGESVVGWTLQSLRRRLLGTHGTFIDLQLTRPNEGRVYKVRIVFHCIPKIGSSDRMLACSRST